MSRGAARARPRRRQAKALVESSKVQEVLRAERFGNEEPESREQHFIDAVARWLQAWVDSADDEACRRTQPCAFVFAADLPTDELLDDVEPALSFRQTHDQDISGQVYVCSLELKQVCRRHVGFTEASAALSWLSTSAAAACVAIVFVAKTRVALVRRGRVSFDDCERLPFGTPSNGPFDFTQVDGLLKQFHEKWTQTHQGYCRIWAKPKDRKLKPLPESQIQGSLKAFFDFTVRPRGVLVEEEFFTYLGRGDVRLVRWPRAGRANNTGDAIESCVMELKVLDAKKSASANRKWALQGIEQVLDYRRTEGVQGPSYLCCFDGRRTDTDIPEVLAEAAKTGVASRRYFMETPGCP